jgi:hypothetical protein
VGAGLAGHGTRRNCHCKVLRPPHSCLRSVGSGAPEHSPYQYAPSRKQRGSHQHADNKTFHMRFSPFSCIEQWSIDQAPLFSATKTFKGNNEIQSLNRELRNDANGSSRVGQRIFRHSIRRNRSPANRHPRKMPLNLDPAVATRPILGEQHALV